MKRHFIWTVVAMLSSGMLYSQDITGDWQGTLKAGIELRLIIRISKQADGSWQTILFSIDQGHDWYSGFPANSVSLEGADVKLKFDAIKGTYEGKLSADGNTIKGTWLQSKPLPLELQRATSATAWHDPSPHRAEFVTVDKDVKLEVLDWGGSGQPLVLLAGLGNTAHIFDKFAPKLVDQFHVYGITRRGFGASSSPASGYSADRLGDDVLKVIDSLKLNRPVLAGHSIAGEELSSIGSRHAQKVSGLVYLYAAYGFAFDDGSEGSETPPKLPPGIPPVVAAIQAGIQKYTTIKSPAPAIYAVPKEPDPGFAGDAAARAKAEADDTARTEAQIKVFEKGAPSSRVVRLPRANHYLFISNEAEVLKEMREFISGLKK